MISASAARDTTHTLYPLPITAKCYTSKGGHHGIENHLPRESLVHNTHTTHIHTVILDVGDEVDRSDVALRQISPSCATHHSQDTSGLKNLIFDTSDHDIHVRRPLVNGVVKAYTGRSNVWLASIIVLYPLKGSAEQHNVRYR